jgi:hypothetical protein
MTDITVAMIDVLVELEYLIKGNKDRYWEDLEKGKPSDAAQWSRIAAAYEHCHILVSHALGEKSMFEESGDDEDDD